MVHAHQDQTGSQVQYNSGPKIKVFSTGIRSRIYEDYERTQDSWTHWAYELGQMKYFMKRTERVLHHERELLDLVVGENEAQLDQVTVPSLKLYSVCPRSTNLYTS